MFTLTIHSMLYMFSKRMLIVPFLLLLINLLSAAFIPKTELSIYVAVTGNDRNPGTKSKPFATVHRALQHLETLNAKQKFEGNINVYFRKGTYFLHEPIRLGKKHSGGPGLFINFLSYKGEEVVISGGRVIDGWQNIEGNLWKANLPEVSEGKWYFRQLFANDQRKTRARSPNANAANPYFFTTGPLSAYAGYIKPWDIFNRSSLFYMKAEAFCGFAFNKGDVLPWADMQNAEVLTHHSWESSWQTIRKVDTVKNEIYFNTPSWCPIGFFGKESNHSRFLIENVREAMDQPGEWYLNKETGELFYLAMPGEDVNKTRFIAPVLEDLMILEGAAASPLQNISFSGLQFHHNNYPMGVYINSIHIKGEGSKPLEKIDWPVFIKKQYPDWPDNFNPGYMEPQAAIYSGQAILVKDATGINFTNCTIAHTGNYGIYISERSHHVSITRCNFFDMGAGGIKLGLPVKDVIASKTQLTDLPYQNNISDNSIHDAGLTLPGCVGIWMGQTRDNQIKHNELYNLPYTGISIGWTWANVPTYTKGNLIANNNIHHVLQTLTDGGGIYTLGRLNESIIKENYIHSVVRHPSAAGGDSQGIFFDESSQGVLVAGNVIHNVRRTIGYNSSKPENMTWGINYLNDSSGMQEAKIIIGRAGPRK